MKLQSLGIRINVAQVGVGQAFISKFTNYNYWLDSDVVLDGSKIMVLEIWVNNRKIIRCFQNTASRLLFCEICSWPNRGKRQIIMADFCDEGFTIPSGSLHEVYEYILHRFDCAAEELTRPGRIRNIIKKIRKYQDLSFAGSLDQFN